MVKSGEEIHLPYDTFCPSLVKKGVLHSRTCSEPTCGQYFPSVAALKRHKICHQILVDEEQTPDEIEEVPHPGHDHPEESAPILSMFDILSGPFCNDTCEC